MKSSTNSVYITTPDGTNIAADVSVPQNGQESAKYPTVLIATRYWRSFKMWVPQPPNSTFIGPRNHLPNYLAQRGFSIVVMDVRGTGASTGVQETPFSESEIKDICHVVDWIVSQPWSNGAVGATGISYEGSTSQLLALQSHPNVMAVNVAEIEMDLYDDVVYPGGILNFGFMNAWSEANTYLDSNRIAPWFPFIIRLLGRGVLPVGNSTELLEKALKDHTSNIDVYASATKVLFKDDPFGISTLQALSPLERIKNQNQIVVPHLCWGGWLDAATARTGHGIMK
ncbi:X-Pro dipeptidyl-peptidase-domain-containing protein [Globomyces pollinis-pini]|nr:X-Pro dipeptidyl-peptidase-domain-containing protein [Globomyces pollinis-pini]